MQPVPLSLSLGYLSRMRLTVAMLTVLLGLASREKPLNDLLPDTVGDGLYAVLVVLLLGEILPRRSPRVVAGLGLALCVGIELSQLWHPAWLDAARATTFGKLVLGRGFLWRDLVAYAVGAAVAARLEVGLRGHGGRVAGR